MPWKKCSAMDERLQFVARRLAGEGMAELCREFGIPRKTGYKIFDRYLECGVQGLMDRSRARCAASLCCPRLWPDVLSNALEPGWVPTKMGGPGAPDDMDAAYRTQVWLAVSNDSSATVTGEYFYHMQLRAPNPVTQDPKLQERLLAECKRLSGVELPAV
jgi:hypothetical protein